ncbi:MAG: hypothetical protein WBN66_06780 [Smithella sp.]
MNQLKYWRKFTKEINKVPFCYKDPHFSYTLPVWEKYLKKDTVFLFINYDDIIDGRGISRISDFLQADISLSFVDASLKRTLPGSLSFRKAEKIYTRLCSLSNAGS